MIFKNIFKNKKYPKIDQYSKKNKDNFDGNKLGKIDLLKIENGDILVYYYKITSLDRATIDQQEASTVGQQMIDHCKKYGKDIMTIAIPF